MRSEIKKIVLTSMFIAIGVILPSLFLTQQIASMFSPMHIPIIICGFLLGWKYGFLAGIITPLLRSAIFTLPPLLPIALAMSFELATYGLIAGLLFEFLPIKKMIIKIYVSLLSAMLIGRAIYGAFMGIYFSLQNNVYTFKAFIGATVITSIFGIVLQLILIPIIVVYLNKFTNPEKGEIFDEKEI